MKLFRCSQLHHLIGVPRSKSEVLTETAKSAIRSIAKDDLFGFKAFTGNKQTQKGVELEDIAISLSGAARFRKYSKHAGRVSNDLITGECDVLDKTNSLIIDTKCSWDIGSHPFFKDEAADKVKKAGYDIQMQAYMWLYGCERAEIDFWLLPCPDHLVGDWDSREQLIGLVEQIDIKHRRTTVVINRDDAVIERIKQVIPHCQDYYAALVGQYKSGVNQ